MAFIYYTIAGIVLYLGSDWLLNRIEMSRGKRLEHRSAIFFVIIVVLAVGSFQMIEYMMTAS
jgi:zinc transporter ZupT